MPIPVDQPRCNARYETLAAESSQWTTAEFIHAATEHCFLSMRNTATGAWLAVALKRLAEEHQNATDQCH